MRVARSITLLLLALALMAGLAACGGGDDNGSGGDTVAEQNGDATTGTTGDTGEDAGATAGEDGEDRGSTGGDGKADESAVEDTSGPARSKEIDELLTLHPIFSTKRFLNFAARGNPGACSLLSDKGRKAMQAAHGASCEDTIRAAAADRDEPGLIIAGEFVPVGEFSNLEFPTTIYVFEREQGRVTIGDERRPMILSQYGRIWLIDSIPLADIGTKG